MSIYRATADAFAHFREGKLWYEMSTTAKRLQDLPPKGGYGPIKTERVKLRSILGGKTTRFVVASNKFCACPLRREDLT